MTHNVQYWIDYWKSLFSGIEHATFALSLISPRVLLRELIEEIETRGLKNQDNKNFLYGQIKAYFKSDPPTQKCLLPILTLICHEFEKPRLELLDQLCRRGLSTIDSLQYFDCAVDILTEKLVADSPVHRDALALICQDLIVELLEVGYSQKTIENIPRDVFSNILEGNGQVHTNFFHEIEYPKDDSDEQAKAAYHAQLKSYMSALTDRDRIQALKRYPRKPPSQFLFIFQIRGLRGKENFDIGPVHFYSPSEKEMLKHNDGKDMEMFGTSDAHVYMNAATKVNTVDSNAGAEIGRQRIIDALNCLRFGFNSKSQFEVGRDYLIVDDEGTLKGFSSGLDKRSGILHWIESLNVDHKTVRTINDAELFQQVFPNLVKNTGRGTVERKLVDSLHWFRKAKEAEAFEDQILWFWIAIENLLNRFASKNESEMLLKQTERESVVSIAFDLLPRLRCIKNAYDRGWNLYRQLNHMLMNPFITPAHDAQVFILPDELKQRSGLGVQDKKVYLKDFVEALPELQALMPECVIKERMAEAMTFYSDDNEAVKMIEKECTMFRNDVVMLYRTRNKIVHSASIGDTMLPYYIRSASEFSRELIGHTMDQFFSKGNRSIEGIITALFSAYDLLLENIKQDGTKVALFEKD